MKKNYALTALITLVVAVSFSQANASGLTYDPSENYYSTYYGIGSQDSVSTTAITTPTVQDSVADLGPHNGYYATYYGTGVEETSLTTEEIALNEEMANPLNYYNW